MSEVKLIIKTIDEIEEILTQEKHSILELLDIQIKMDSLLNALKEIFDSSNSYSINLETYNEFLVANYGFLDVCEREDYKLAYNIKFLENSLEQLLSSKTFYNVNHGMIKAAILEPDKMKDISINLEYFVDSTLKKEIINLRRGLELFEKERKRIKSHFKKFLGVSKLKNGFELENGKFASFYDKKEEIVCTTLEKTSNKELNFEVKSYYLNKRSYRLGFSTGYISESEILYNIKANPEIGELLEKILKTYYPEKLLQII